MAEKGWQSVQIGLKVEDPFTRTTTQQPSECWRLQGWENHWSSFTSLICSLLHFNSPHGSERHLAPHVSGMLCCAIMMCQHDAVRCPAPTRVPSGFMTLLQRSTEAMACTLDSSSATVGSRVEGVVMRGCVEQEMPQALRQHLSAALEWFRLSESHPLQKGTSGKSVVSSNATVVQP